MSNRIVSDTQCRAESETVHPIQYGREYRIVLMK